MVSFISPRYVESEVAGNALKFYPNSIKRLVQLKGMTTTVADALTKLFTRAEGNSEVVEEDLEGEDGFKQHRTVIAAPSIEILQHQAAEKTRLIERLVGLLLDEANHVLLGSIIMDSLRDDCDRNFKPDDAIEFMSSLDAGSFSECMIGVMKANARSLGPLGKAIAAKIKGWTEAAIAAQQVQVQPEETPVESEEEATTRG